MAESQKTIWNARAEQWSRQAEDPENFYSHRAGHVAEFIRDTVPTCRSLEVGCGPGLLLEHLLNYGYDANACDLSDGMVEAARARNSRPVDEPTSRVLLSTEDELPFDDDFGLVVAIGVFPYVVDYAAFLQMLSAKLQGDGYICAQCTNRYNLVVFARVAREVLRRNWRSALNLIRFGPPSAGVDLASARQCHSARSFDQLFARFDHKRIAAFGMYRLRRLDVAPLTRGRLDRFLVRHLGWNYIAIYRKKTPGRLQ